MYSGIVRIIGYVIRYSVGSINGELIYRRTLTFLFTFISKDFDKFYKFSIKFKFLNSFKFMHKKCPPC